MINRYLSQAVYVDGGRGPIEYDCWGLAREVRHLVCGMRLLPELGAVGYNNLIANTRAYREECHGMRLCDKPEHGAIAAAFRGRALHHVGVVLKIDGQLCVLEINPDSKARRVTIPKFESGFQEVRYYND